MKLKTLYLMIAYCFLTVGMRLKKGSLREVTS